ncbi:MAG TPA: type I DNA topoisomerase [Candidatus Marinimicrobia bacterium]|nr:type I DNA topoisomerase [Candidatus Neomarinimicrobiota bacterium]
MTKKLLIVESPSKARTIKKYLGADFTVLASVGHIRDLPEKELGIDIEKDFKPKYVTIKGKTKIIQQLKAAAKDADTIYLAPDPDREGEAIAWHIAAALKVPEDRILRVLFNEITKSGVQYGIKHPRKIDLSLVNAQQARRVVDRLVGYQVSPVLWKTLYRGLSAGRVQSVALRIICEREAEINNFVAREFWDLTVDLEATENQQFTAKCVKIAGKKPDIPDEKTVRRHETVLKNATYIIDSVKEKEVSKSPPPPFITSTLQQETTRRFHYPATKTMVIAQQLYEGIDIGGERVGLITYMRTDSVRISKEAIDGVRDFVSKRFGPEYLPNNPRYFKTRKKNIQDAHEGIRPTRFDLSPDQISEHLSPDQKKLYQLIWNRFAASQMAPARYQQKTVDVKAGDYLFRVVSNDLVFDGFLKAWREEKKEEVSRKLPEKLTQGEEVSLIKLNTEQKFTEPPSRFSEGTLIKELDNLGIGRPSTYASIVSTILNRKYVERKTGTLIPTDLGKTVNQILVQNMPKIVNVKFTAEMEEDLDEVEGNKKAWLDVIREFYKPFKESLDSFDTQRKQIKASLHEKTDEKCELCGSEMVIKWSRNGKFMACSGFPECRNTRPILDTPAENLPEKTCPKCEGKMVVKQGRYGKFWACSNYPKCKTTEPFTLNIACPEPGCEGKLVEKRTRKGKTFYGCSAYPNCKFATWNEPVAAACPSCNFGILERKESRSKGSIIICPKCKTEFEEQDERLKK